MASGRHLTFEPRLEVARWLVEHTTINAMMDLSDGLSMDLHRMMQASHTGALLHAEAIPIHKDVPEQLSDSQRLHAALGDGEDFELVICIPEFAVVSLVRKTEEFSIPLHDVGVVTEGTLIRLQDSRGSLQIVTEMGWQHGLS
jgi:thiamine-monophosphate kinase